MDPTKTTIRFKCPHCQKPLSVKDHLAGRKAACPVCKKSITVPERGPLQPALPTVDVESVAAEALADKPVDKPPDPSAGKTIDLTCPYCDEELQLPAALGGKQTPCPKCSRLIKVPLLKSDKPKDWRTTQKGPSAALLSQPEQLSEAWGTEQKGRVSREAMLEAGAVREPRAQPLGARGWVRRGLWFCLLGGAAVLLIGMANRSRVEKREQNHLEEAKKYLEKLDTLQQAEFHRAAGEIDVRNLRANDAQNKFLLARSLLSEMGGRKAAARGLEPEEFVDTLERDLLLIKLVLSQAEMGGSGDETLKRGLVVQRFDWKDEIVQKDMLQTLEAIQTPGAKAAALRYLACKLMDKDKGEVAISLAGVLANQQVQFKAQLVGMLLARNLEVAAEQMAAPNLEKPIADTPARIAYAEGHAFKKDFAEALKFASAKGPSAARLEASVAAAAIALASAKNPSGAKDALPFIREGLAAYADMLKENKDAPPTWAVLELIRLGSRTDAAEEIKGIALGLPAPFRSRAQLDVFQGQLERNPAKPGEAGPIEEIGDAKQPTRAFAWEALARHNARLGYGGAINPEDVNESCRPFVHLGFALGEQDRNK